MAFRNPFISITSFYQTLGWAPTKPMSVLCRKTDTILSVFVGFSLPTQTDTNFFINRHGVGFLSVFCRFSVGFGPRFSTKQGKILIYFGRVYGFCKLKIIKSLLKKDWACYSIIGSISYHYLLNFNDLNTPKTPLRPYLVSL